MSEERIEQLTRERDEARAKQISVTYGDLCAAEPEMTDAVQPYEWDNWNTVEQQEFLLTIVRRQRAGNARLTMEHARLRKALEKCAAWFQAETDTHMDTPENHRKMANMHADAWGSTKAALSDAPVKHPDTERLDKLERRLLSGPWTHIAIEDYIIMAIYGDYTAEPGITVHAIEPTLRAAIDNMEES